MPRRRAVLASLAAALAGLAWARPAVAQVDASPPSPPPAEASPAPRQPPGRYYLGADALWASISSHHPSVDGSSGAGLQLDFGMRLTEALALDMRLGGFFDTRVGPTPEISYPSDRADYAIMQLGLVWEALGGGAPVSPWAGAWVGYHSVRWKTYWYSVSGLGVSLGAGAQFRLPLGLIRLGATVSLVDAASTYGAPTGGTAVATISGGWIVDWGRIGE